MLAAKKCHRYKEYSNAKSDFLQLLITVGVTSIILLAKHDLLGSKISVHCTVSAVEFTCALKASSIHGHRIGAYPHPTMGEMTVFAPD
jgi:hypothetical protein